MGISHPRRGPSLVLLIILVILSYVVTSSNCETLTSLNDLQSWETRENNVSLSNAHNQRNGKPQLSEEVKYTKQNDLGDPHDVHEKSSTHSMDHRRHQQSLSASNREEDADVGTRNATTSANNGNDERNNSYGEANDGGSRRPPVPSLSSGGGIAGALKRLAGTVPMLASKLSSHMGFARRKRHVINDYPLIPHHHMATIENLNDYYSSLTNSTTGERPTPEQVKVHRKYLLDLLQQMSSPNRGDNADHNIGIFKKNVMSTLPGAHKQNPTQSALTKSQQELLTPSPSGTTASPSSSGNYGPNMHNGPNFMNIPRANKPGDASETQFASRMGQFPSDHNVDIQNLPIEKAALLLHQLQTQGQANLLPQNFLRQVQGAAQEPPRGLEAMFSQNEAVKRMGNPAGALRTDPPRHGDDFLHQPPWSFRSRPTQSLTSANIDPISGHYHPSYHSPESLTTSSGNPIRVSVPEVYDKPIPAMPGTYISENLPQPALSDFGQVQAISQIEEGKLVLPQDTMTGSASILDNFPDQSALINPQNFPDLIEGLKVLAPSDQHSQSLSLADIMQNLPIESLNSNGYSDHEFLLNALRIIQQYNNFQGTNSQNKVDSTLSQPQNLLELTLPASSDITNVNQLYNQGYAQSIAPAASAARPQAVPVRDLVPNQRLTDTLSTAFEDLKTDIVDAIAKFVGGLADAIKDQPALLLLGLIPLAFLFFSLFQHFGVSIHYMGKGNNSGGHSSGGQSSYGRKSFVSKNPHEEAEILATRILTNIDRFENWQKRNSPNSRLSKRLTGNI